MLPPFPTDDTTLDMLEAAIAPWEHGHPEAVQSSVYPMLELMSQLGGSDTKAVAEVVDDGGDGGASIVVMRDPQYTSNCVMLALIAEIRRLRATTATSPAPGHTLTLQEQIRQAVKGLLAQQRLTQAALAARIRISNKHMSQLMRGKSPISTDLAEQMLAALDRRPALRVLPVRADTPEGDRQPTGGDVARQPHQVPQDIADMLEQAWNIIANAGLHLGGWEAQHVEWVQAAMRWRDEQYFPWLKRHCAR